MRRGVLLGRLCAIKPIEFFISLISALRHLPSVFRPSVWFLIHIFCYFINNVKFLTTFPCLCKLTLVLLHPESNSPLMFN
jgi:hypothetical protein